MARYIALLEVTPDGCGVSFHDLPGCTAMGDDVEGALRNAVEALRDWVEVTEARGGEVPAPTPVEALEFHDTTPAPFGKNVILVLVPLVRENSRMVKANLSLDSGVLAAIDATADRLRMTRSSVVEALAKRGLAELS